jgi:hypothetical protein
MVASLHFQPRRKKLKDSITFNEIVAPEIVKLADQFLSYSNDNFCAQVEFLNLDPKLDFKNADLCGVDFSESDIRGFDFTGSDLRGATGINVQWDSSTILANAETDSSIFSYRLSSDRFFAGRPHLAERVRRLTNEYWTKAVLGVEEILTSGKGNTDSIWIAKAVFDETRDIVVKSNVLFFMRKVSDSPEDHKNFVFNVFARHSGQTNVLVSAIRTLNALYRNDIGALNLLVRCLNHPEPRIRSEALNGILASIHLKSVLDRVRQLVIASDNSILRRKFLGCVARMAGREYVTAAMDTEINNFIDFNEVISKRKLHVMAQNALIREKNARIASEGLQRYSLDLVGSLSVDEGKVADRAKAYRALLEDLRAKYGIPLAFET